MSTYSLIDGLQKIQFFPFFLFGLFFTNQWIWKKDVFEFVLLQKNLFFKEIYK